MSKFKRVMGEKWYLIVICFVSFVLFWALIHSLGESRKRSDQAEKLCYPYVVMVQNDEIVVCAGIEEPVVKKRK